MLSLTAIAACGDASQADEGLNVRDAGRLSQDTLAPSAGRKAESGAAAGNAAAVARACTQPGTCSGGSSDHLQSPAQPATTSGAAGARAASSSDDPDADAGVSGAADHKSDDLARAVFATVEIDEGTSFPQLGNGDLWPTCWSNDDALYTAAGDGIGFGLIYYDVLTARIDGTPGEASYRGTQLASGDGVGQIWSGGSNYTRKPTGMLCLKGDLYIAVQDLSKSFDDAPVATIARSTDKGRTWNWEHSGPMFTDRTFTTIMFLDYGKDSEHAPDDYVYAYGLDGAWAFTDTKPGPTRMFLGRVPKDKVQSRADWQFYAGNEANGEPRFTQDIAARVPVLEDTRRVCSKPLDPKLRFQNMTAINQGGVVYDAPLQRYIYTSWTEYTFELYEAPAPWGPFKLFFSKDFGVWPWDNTQNGGYGTTIPSKFISEDGKHMLLQANSWGADTDTNTGKDNYSFSLRKLHLEPPQTPALDNARGDTNLAATAAGAVRLTRALRAGHAEVMNDGMLQAPTEDSWNGEAKDEDFWGYTWTTPLHANVLRYTTGEQKADGGYFEQLGVQMRKGEEWVDVPLKSVEPEYPGNSSVAALTTYTLRFDDIVTDGLRIFGKPGGSAHYTSIAELSVSFE